MKKIVTTLLALLIVLTMTGCASKASSTAKSDGEADNNKPKVEETKKKDKKTPPVTIEELPFDVTILEPDSIGTVYMEATFTNNSKYAIKGFAVTVLLKDKNETGYLSSYDTVLSGETSPTFKSFGPETRSADDVEYLEYQITVVDESGEEIYLTYDAKLKTYKWY